MANQWVLIVICVVSVAILVLAGMLSGWIDKPSGFGQGSMIAVLVALVVVAGLLGWLMAGTQGPLAERQTIPNPGSAPLTVGSTHASELSTVTTTTTTEAAKVEEPTQVEEPDDRTVLPPPTTLPVPAPSEIKECLDRRYYGGWIQASSTFSIDEGNLGMRAMMTVRSPNVDVVFWQTDKYCNGVASHHITAGTEKSIDLWLGGFWDIEPPGVEPQFEGPPPVCLQEDGTDYRFDNDTHASYHF